MVGYLLKISEAYTLLTRTTDMLFYFLILCIVENADLIKKDQFIIFIQGFLELYTKCDEDMVYPEDSWM